MVAVAAVFFAFFGAGVAFRSDEAITAGWVGRSFGELTALLRADVHPPLYYYLLFSWVRIFGAGETAIRSLSGLLYLASAGVLYCFARRLAGSGVALIAAALYVTAPLAIIGAHMGRMYALLSLLSVLSTWLYWDRYFGGRPGARTLAAYVAVNVLGSFTHIWFFFLLFGQGVTILLFARQRTLAAAAAIAASVAPYAILWLPVLLAQQLAASRDAAAWLLPPGPAAAAKLILLYAGALLLFAPALAWLAWKRRARPLPWAGVFASVLLLAVGAPMVASLVKPVYSARFTIIGLHLFALVAGAYLARISDYRLPLALVLATAAPFTWQMAREGRCDTRWAADYLARHARSRDIVIYASLNRAPIASYLNGRTRALATSFPAEIDTHPGYEGTIVTDPRRRPELEREADTLIDRIREAMSRQRDLRVFFLYGFRPEVDEVLDSRLRLHLSRVDELCVDCDARPSYFDHIAVYGSRTTLAGGR